MTIQYIIYDFLVLISHIIVILTQSSNHNLYVSADCRDSSLDETWQKIKTSPDLPVTHGTEISLSCETGYTLAGSQTATCNNGIVQPASIPPQCLGMISLMSGEIRAFSA